MRLDAAAPVSTVHAVGAGTNTFSFGDGLAVGQRKTVVLGSKDGAGAAATSVTLDAAGESVSLVWASSRWNVSATVGGAVV